MRRLPAAVIVVFALAGCGTEDRHAASSPPADVRAAIAAQGPRCVAGSFRRLGSAKLAYAGIVQSSAVVYGGDRKPLGRFGSRNVNGVATIFSVRGARVAADCKPRAYLVQVPKRPNGITGWVSAPRLVVATVHTRILVDLSTKRLTLYRNGRPVLSSAVAIGARATPTPTGSFYVNQRLIPADTGGPFGPGAVGISAFSDVLTGWTQGGPIAIHGTNAPWSIGHAVSNGCIRLPNAVLRRVFAQAYNGTPVLIRS
jgi:lipoprotein-anchoring transpeptidase ErfK/SrfK